MEVTVSRDLPEGLSEAFRMRTHNRSVGVIVRVQTVPVTEQIGALIRLYAVYLHAVLLLSREGHASAGPHGPVTATSSLTAEFEARSRPAWARPCVSRNAGRITADGVVVAAQPCSLMTYFPRLAVIQTNRHNAFLLTVYFLPFSWNLSRVFPFFAQYPEISSCPHPVAANWLTLASQTSLCCHHITSESFTTLCQIKT